MNFREMGIDGKNWMQLAPDSLNWWDFVNTGMNLRVHNKSGLSIYKPSTRAIDFSKNFLHHGVSK